MYKCYKDEVGDGGKFTFIARAIEALEGSAVRKEKEKRMFSHYSTTNV